MSQKLRQSISQYPPAVASGKLENFVLLPGNPAIALTQEQLNTLFPPSNRPVVIREMVKLRGK